MVTTKRPGKPPQFHRAPNPLAVARGNGGSIIKYRYEQPEEGYRCLTFMILNADIAAVSPSSVYSVLLKAGLLATNAKHHQTKGSGFQQPVAPHQHWHLDISYINFKNTFVYLVALIDGFSMDHNLLPRN